MGFWNQKKGIVWVRPWGYEWLTKFQFPATQVMGQEVIEAGELEKSVTDWVNREMKGRLKEAEIVVGDGAVFSKEVTEQRLVEEFWFEVPIDPVKQGRLVVKGEKSWKLFATNSEIYSILERALGINKIKVSRVVPEAIKQLPKYDFRQKGGAVKTKKSPKSAMLAMSILAVLVLMGVMIYKFKTPATRPASTQEIIAVSTPQTSEAPTPSAAVEMTVEIDKENLKIKILNGSGAAGKAGEMKDFLTSLGYGEIETGNADTDEYFITEVNIKEDGEAIWQILGADLRSKYTISTQSGKLESEAAEDVLIVIGKDQIL